MKDKGTFVHRMDFYKTSDNSLNTFSMSKYEMVSVSKGYIFVHIPDVLKSFKCPNGKEQYDKSS